jgi:hypothetical protein
VTIKEENSEEMEEDRWSEIAATKTSPEISLKRPTYSQKCGFFFRHKLIAYKLHKNMKSMRDIGRSPEHLIFTDLERHLEKRVEENRLIKTDLLAL